MAAGTCGAQVGRNSTQMAGAEFGWEQETLNLEMGRNRTQIAEAKFGCEQGVAGLKLAGIASGLEKRFEGLRIAVSSKWLKDLDGAGACGPQNIRGDSG